jgi:hypothetical protein
MSKQRSGRVENGNGVKLSPLTIRVTFTSPIKMAFSINVGKPAR